MGFAWAVLLPLGKSCQTHTRSNQLLLGAAFARGLRVASPETRPLWYKAHLFTQIFGLSVAIIGWAIALLKFEDITDTLHHHGMNSCTLTSC